MRRSLLESLAEGSSAQGSWIFGDVMASSSRLQRETTISTASQQQLVGGARHVWPNLRALYKPSGRGHQALPRLGGADAPYGLISTQRR